MSKTVTVGLSLAMGLAIGVGAGSRLMNPPAEAQTAAAPASFGAGPGAVGADDIFGPYGGAGGRAERSDHAPGPREMDIWRRPRHLRREPEPRVSARRRRVAGHAASAGEAADRYRSERAIPNSRSAVAQRQYHLPARRRRVAPG